MKVHSIAAGPTAVDVSAEDEGYSFLKGDSLAALAPHLHETINTVRNLHAEKPKPSTRCQPAHTRPYLPVTQRSPTARH